MGPAARLHPRPLSASRGFGFNANATIVDQKGSGAAPATALGVAKYTYNITGYYEHGGISLRLTQTFQKGAQVTGLGQNGIAAAAFYTKDYHQLDFGSSFDLEKITGMRHAPEITFDVVNITKQTLGQLLPVPQRDPAARQSGPHVHDRPARPLLNEPNVPHLSGRPDGAGHSFFCLSREHAVETWLLGRRRRLHAGE